MKRIRIIGLTLVAVFAMSVVIASAASAALPEFYQGNSPLTKKTAFTGSAGESKLVSAAATIVCKADTSKGDLVNSKDAEKIKITYTECSLAADPAIKCETKKSKPGEILTEELKGELVYASETVGGTEVAGQEFTPGEGTVFAKFSCDEGAIEVEVTGAVIGEVAPINTESSTGSVILREKAVETEAGCGKQQLLYVAGATPCEHLTALGGPAWNITDESISYGTKKVEVRA